jgi:hypothetical protein
MARLPIPLLALVALSSCRIDPLPGPPFHGSDGTDDPDSSDPSAGGGGTSTASSGGTAAGAAPDPRGGAGGSGAEPPPEACAAEDVTLDEVRSGVVLPSARAALVATATSQKFLVSETEAGSCLWGAFVGDEPDGAEPRGLLVVSYGDEAPGAAPCEPGTDAIADALEPGDVVRIVGRASSFAPSSCDGVTPAAQFVADARCPFDLQGRVAPLEPVTLPLDVASKLVRGSDAELVGRWAGGLVRLESVSALPNEGGTGAVRPYGVVALAETDLEVHADIEYGDLSGNGPRDAAKGLDFHYPTEFRSVTGLVFLDYCEYALAPRRRCEDFDPPSLDCR